MPRLRVGDQGVYKPEQIEGGWKVFYHYPKGSHLGDVKRPVDDGKVYPQRQAAYRRSKDLNDRRTSNIPATTYVRISTMREYCPAIVKKLMEMVPHHGITVHDPLNTDEESINDRYITCGLLCRYRDDDFDPDTPVFISQPPTQKEFLDFLESVRTLPGVIELNVSGHSFPVYPRYALERE